MSPFISKIVAAGLSFFLCTPALAAQSSPPSQADNTAIHVPLNTDWAQPDTHQLGTQNQITLKLPGALEGSEQTMGYLVAMIALGGAALATWAYILIFPPPPAEDSAENPSENAEADKNASSLRQLQQLQFKLMNF